MKKIFKLSSVRLSIQSFFIPQLKLMFTFLLGLAFVIYSIGMQGQGIYNDGATIVISSGAYVYIDGGSSGDYLADHDGLIDLDGELHIEGDWTNNNASSKGFSNRDTDGMVRFVGTQSGSSIGGTQDTEFEDLEINRTGGTVTNLGANVFVNDELALTAGVVSTGANTLVMESTTTGKLTAYSNSNFVNGNLRRNFSGTAAYEFPVGNGNTSSDYYRMTFLSNALDLSGATDYVTAFIETIAKSGNNIDSRITTTQDGTLIRGIAEEAGANALVWRIDPSNATVSSGDFGLRLYFENIATALSDNKFTVVKRDDSSTDFADWATDDGSTTIPALGDPGLTVASGYAERTSGWTSFSDLAIGWTQEVLPVELTLFEALCMGENHLIKWETATETNNDYFTIEKSTDGLEWEEVKRIESQSASGNSSTALHYSFTAPNNGNSMFYQLKQTDYDNQFSTSLKITAPSCQGSRGTNEKISAWFSQNSFIQIDINSQSAESMVVHLIDASGKQIINAKQIPVNKGENHYQLHTGKPSSGIYFISIKGNTNTYTNKLWVY